MEKIFTQYVLENCCSIFHLLRSPIISCISTTISHWKTCFYFEMQNLPLNFLLKIRSRYRYNWTSCRSSNINGEWQTADIQARIEMLLKGDPSKSYSKEEIIEELSNADENSEVERTWRKGSIKFSDESKIATQFYLQKWNCLLSMEMISIMLRLYEATRTYMICCCPLPVPVRSFNCF